MHIFLMRKQQMYFERMYKVFFYVHCLGLSFVLFNSGFFFLISLFESICFSICVHTTKYIYASMLTMNRCFVVIFVSFLFFFCNFLCVYMLIRQNWWKRRMTLENFLLGVVIFKIIHIAFYQKTMNIKYIK